MPLQEKQLGQSRPTGTTVVSLYSPGASITGIITSIIICNQSGVSAAYRIFLDDDGAVYDESTALFWDIVIAGEATHVVEARLPMNDEDGNLAVRSDTGNALTFTALGKEIT
ncbi:hypothetical protein LCGC14_0705760 [marine sediment metagenome]|uniref:Uncharacterized protein n=1 Tax=marine sediment metagenome TaxID=412755 RepID=A0A0F9QGJ9_9ZZZZ|nr:hypothetical protein [bacterium]